MPCLDKNLNICFSKCFSKFILVCIVSPATLNVEHLKSSNTFKSELPEPSLFLHFTIQTPPLDVSSDLTTTKIVSL